MFNIIKRLVCLNFKSINNITKNTPRQWEIFQKFTDQDLYNLNKVNSALSIKMPKRGPKSQRNLYHGKQTKTGWETSFSEKKNKRFWKVNVTQRKNYFSQVLGRNVNVRLSTEAYRQMRRLGSFDNYVLLTKPQKLDSFFGEYLRTLMLRKLNNPQFKVPQIAKCKRTKISRFKKRKLRFIVPKRYHGIQGVWHPPDQRYIDLSHLKFKLPSQMNRKEFDQFEEIRRFNDEQKDIPSDHPFLQQLTEQMEKEREQLEPDRQRALEMLKKIKNQKALKNFYKYSQEGVKEFKKPTIPKD